MESYTAREVARRGKGLYLRRIRALVEPDHEGRFLAVDMIGGEYALADDELEAFDRAREKAPEDVLQYIGTVFGGLTNQFLRKIRAVTAPGFELKIIRFFWPYPSGACRGRLRYFRTGVVW